MSDSRTALVCVAFAVGCLVSSARLVVDAPSPARLKDANAVARRSDERFAALRTALPARGVVGYIGESGPLALGDYYLAQYALAPVVVDHSPNHGLVIGNFPATPPASPPADLRLLKDFGNGVMLFSGKDK